MTASSLSTGKQGISPVGERPVALRSKVSVTIDGESIDVLEGDTILDACNKAGKGQFSPRKDQLSLRQQQLHGNPP